VNEDLEVIRRILAGDTDAFRLLVVRYQRPLFCLIRNLVPGPDAEDIAQDVFLAAFANLAGFDQARAGFSTWLFTIARNRCLAALKKRRPVLCARLPERADSRTPEAEASEEEWFRRLDAALEQLPFGQRTAFVLAQMQGLALDEIARIEGVSVGTVKSRLGRARDKLRALLPRPVERS
jgi:RNA polymerase sigma-70 factor (ECF subfamily)